jgi:hypothetical protein
MDLSVLGLALLLELFLMLLGLVQRPALIEMFAGIVGLLLFAGLAIDGGIVSYWSGGNEIDITLGTFGMMIILIPTILSFVLLIRITTQEMRGTA